MENVAVFFGGESVEHDISVITGALAANSLDREKYEAVPVYVDKNGGWYTGDALFDLDFYKSFERKKLRRVSFVSGENALYEIKGKRLKKLCAIAAAVNCMHGERGEDGSLAGIMKMNKIAFASPPILPSAVSMDKCFTKIVMKGLKIKTLPCVTVRQVSDCERVKAAFSYPIIIKPACSGSSIGITKATDDASLYSGISYALRFDERAIAEPCLTGFTEINCAAYRGKDGVRVSECERPVGRTEILSFKDKYNDGKRVFPADIDGEISRKIKKITERIYEQLLFEGAVRIDYFVKDGEVILNEINSVPGSLAYYLFSDTLKGFTEMLGEMITEAKERAAAQGTLVTEYKSGVLGGIAGKGGKR